MILTNSVIFANDMEIKSQKLEDIAKVNEAEIVNIYGIETRLYKTFNDNEVAIENIYETVGELIEQIKIYGGLNHFNEDSVMKYQESFLEMLNDDYVKRDDRVSNKEIILLYQFFDIYENDSKNQTIKTLMEDKSINSYMRLQLLLPYTETIANENFAANAPIVWENLDEKDLHDFSMQKVGIPNLNKAIRYAEDWADSYNTDEYDAFKIRGDCTNFVSQILENGGVKQVKYDDEFKGWWHEKPSGWFSGHKHSVSWINADTFARYMGVVKTYNNHRSFSAGLFPGAIIAADFDSDGDWDHLGFVTRTDSRLGDYDNGRYYDYKVAQHTKNYHAWASSDECGWDEMGSATYARIRD
jgi:hypothetical protein